MELLINHFAVILYKVLPIAQIFKSVSL